MGLGGWVLFKFKDRFKPINCPFEKIGCKSFQMKMCQFTHEKCVSVTVSVPVETTHENGFEKLPEGQIHCSEWEQQVVNHHG